MEALSYTNAPTNYRYCINEKCPLAQHCLRALAWKDLPSRLENVWILNPSRTNKGNQCEYFRDSAPVTYASGLLGMQTIMYPSQYKRFSMDLISMLGRSQFFDCRKGVRFITPSDQAKVQQALGNSGASIPLKFDKYKDDLLW